MADIIGKLNRAERESTRVGPLLLGLAAFDGGCDLLLDVEGVELRRFRLNEVEVTLTGLTITGEMAIPFASLREWNADSCGGDSEGPCISFETNGRNGYICPAEPIDELVDGLRRTIDRLIADQDGEFFYVSDLNGPVRSERRDAELDRDADVLRVGDERFPVPRLVWLSEEVDGDGNTFWHLVSADGRYRRICFGDLGR